MVLVLATLASNLESLEPSDNELDAIDNLAGAWEGYFAGASVLGIPTTTGSLAGATTAMKGALVGLSAPGAAPAVIQAGILAFWGVVSGAAATIWITVPPTLAAILSPGAFGIAAALPPVFLNNRIADLSLAQAAQAVAAVLHLGGIGGIATLPPPPVGPGPVPIL